MYSPASNPAISINADHDFSIEIIARAACSTNIIDISGLTLDSTYTIGDSELIQQIQQGSITQTETVCPAIIITISNSNGSQIDPIFTHDAVTSELKTQTADPLKAGTYPMKLEA